MSRIEYEDYGEATYPFWSKSELVRIGVIGGLALFPLSIGALDAAPQAHIPRHPPSAMIAAVPAQAGRLTSIRIVPFDAAKLSLKSMGDVDETAR
jgi:hypothetical protein